MAANNLNLALALARRGWFIFQCGEDKRPLCYWQKDSTTNETQVARLWTQRPWASIGVDCEKSGIFAIDLDDKDGKRGSQTWGKLVDTYGGGKPVAVGPAQKTPSGGYHLIFRWYPPDLTIPNKVNGLGEGIDLRSKGYFCTGSQYEWLEEHGVEMPLSDPPAWLVGLVRNLSIQPEYKPRGELIRVEGLQNYFLEKYVREATIGNRNQTGFELACQLRDCGLDIHAAWRYMAEYARRVPQGGKDSYTREEALNSLKSAYNGARREPPGGDNG